MRKIVFVHLFNDLSGSPKVLSQVIRAMHSRKRPIEILTSDHLDGFLSKLPGLRRNIFYRRSENKVVTLLYFLLTQTILFFYCLRYWRQDAEFYINTMMPCGAALAAKVMNKDVTYHVHETSIRPPLLKFFLRLAIKVTAKKIIYVSDYLRKVEGFSNKHQFTVVNAIDTPLSSLDADSNHTTFKVLMICSLKTYKGVQEFLDIAKLSLGIRSVNFVLVVNAEKHEIDTFFFDRQTPSNTTVMPRQSNVHSFYAEASLLLNLSRTDEWIETFGLTIVEAMSYGVPVIVPPVGGPAEIVTDGHDGYLISCYETKKIAEAIARLATNVDLYQHLSINAKTRAKDFNLNTFETSIAKIIDL